jgi:hypothetical protein
MHVVKTWDELAFARPELLSSGDFQAYELRSVLDVSQVRGREGKTREKLTFPRILVAGRTVYGVPLSWLRRQSILSSERSQQVLRQSILTSATETEKVSVGGEAFKI